MSPRRSASSCRTSREIEIDPAAADLYFAYGSNLDPEDWTAYCLARDFDPGILRPVGPAILPDERLVFDYRSIRREGGVLNIRRESGSAVAGFLFAVPRDGWAALDTKEGHPHRYRREIVAVCDPAGRRLSAWTYRVVPALCAGFVAPSPAYLAVCRAGRARRGLDGDGLERAARDGRMAQKRSGVRIDNSTPRR